MSHMPPSSPSADPSKAMIDACLVCDLVRVRGLLAAGASADTRDEEGRPVLFSAVLGNSIGLLGLLLESGADINARDEQGWTALHVAAEEQTLEIARLLIARGADVNAQDDDGNSVLWRAIFAARGRGEMIRLLLESGAKEDLPNRLGETATELAARLGESW